MRVEKELRFFEEIEMGEKYEGEETPMIVHSGIRRWGDRSVDVEMGQSDGLS